jgi:OmcA/MtrC family decaheme c-type cytochrome
MERKPLKRFGAMIGSGLAVLILAGCNGGTGQTGANTSSVVTPVANTTQMTQSDWAALNLTGTVKSVDMSKGTPTVTFTVTNGNGVPVIGLSANTTKSSTALMSSYANFGFSIAKLVPGPGGNSQWVSYIINSTPTTTTPSGPAHPSTDNTGFMTEDGLGTYTYTFYRDITQAAAFVTNATYNAAKNQLQADLGDVSYQPNLTHRISIMVGGAYRGTSTNTADTTGGGPAVYTNRAANIIYDFVPATGLKAADAATKVVVNADSCNACHTKLGSSFHTGGEMNDPRYCVMCHTEQQKFGQADALPASGTKITASGSVKLNGMAVGNVTGFIHRLHMGDQLGLTGYNFGGVLFNNVAYPQDIRNCDTCHTGTNATAAVPTPQSGNYQNVPSIEACGACHDTVNFVTGAGHGPNNLPQASDAACTGCHAAADIAVYHTPVWTPLQAGSNIAPLHGGMQSYSYQATNPANQPKGSHTITWNLISATVPGGIPTLTFSILMDGQPITLNAPPSTVPGTTTQVDMFPSSAPFVNNLFGANTNAPDFFMIAGLPQDGIVPADYNYRLTPTLKSIWSGAAAAATLPITWTDNKNSTYTITATGYKLPTGTGVVAMGIGLGLLTEVDLGAVDPSLISSYIAANSAPFTAMDFTYSAKGYTVLPTGGLLVPSKVQIMNVAASTTGGIPTLSRRTIIKVDACNTCHGTLGAFTATTGANNFHSVGIGDGNDGASCVICHNTTGVDGTAYSYNTKPWVHAIHAASMRDNPYTPEAAGGGFWNIGYPGLLNNCEVCHVAGSYDFSNATNAAQVPNMLWDTVAKGTPAVAGTNPTSPAISYPATVVKSGVTTTYTQPQSVSQAAAQGTAWVPPTVPVTGTTTITGTGYYSPFISMTGTYGSNAAWTAPTTKGGTWNYTPAEVALLTASASTLPTGAGATGSLVVSPITSACSSCHDTPSAIAHFKGNGGVFYGDRAVLGGLGTPVASGTNFAFPTGKLVNTEQCLVCHGSGGVADIKTVHMNY